MAKYHYRRYLYGTNSKRSNCSEFQNGNCLVDVDSCPGFDSCSIYKNLKVKLAKSNDNDTEPQMEIKPVNKAQKHNAKEQKKELIKLKTNCVIEIMPKKEIIIGIVSKFSTNHFFSMNMVTKTIKRNVDFHTLNVKKIYVGFNDLRYLCTTKNADNPFIDSSEFVTARFEFESITSTNDPITKSKVLYHGKDDYYGDISIREDYSIPCVVEITAKKLKTEEIIEKNNYFLHIQGLINSKKVSFDKIDIHHVFIGFDDCRYELVFNKKLSSYKEINGEVVMDLYVTNSIYSPGRVIKTKSQIIFNDSELSQISIKKCPID